AWAARARGAAAPGSTEERTAAAPAREPGAESLADHDPVRVALEAVQGTAVRADVRHADVRVVDAHAVGERVVPAGRAARPLHLVVAVPVEVHREEQAVAVGVPRRAPVEAHHESRPSPDLFPP